MSIFETTLDTFERDVVQASHHRPVLVDFWADWCAPCLIIAPVLERVIADLDGGVALAKLEVDAGENMKLAGRHQVRGFPTVILFDAGREVGRFSGARSGGQILEFLHGHIDLPDTA
jgi:putative thioredoxin